MVFFYFMIVLSEIIYLLSRIIGIFVRKDSNFAERLGMVYPGGRYDILMHAASVGEINGVRPLVNKLLDKFPKIKIVITLNTVAGKKILTDLNDKVTVTLAPLDIFHLRMNQLQQLKPRLIMIAENEIWPQLLFAAAVKKIPVLFVNARMSARTFERLKKYSSFILPPQNSIERIVCQSEQDSERFSLIFHKPVQTENNLKFAVDLPDYNQSNLRQDKGYAQNDFIITFGSSRPGEEKLLIETYLSLKKEIAELKLVIAPRHLKRMAEVEELLTGIAFSRQSDGVKAQDIHLLDTMGELDKAYALSDVCIIGGSFFPFGGHNPLEAAFYGKIIIMGEYHQTCIDSVKKLQAADAILISKAENLTQNLLSIYQNRNYYLEMGERAKTVMQKNRLSLNNYLTIIQSFVS